MVKLVCPNCGSYLELDSVTVLEDGSAAEVRLQCSDMDCNYPGCYTFVDANDFIEEE